MLDNLAIIKMKSKIFNNSFLSTPIRFLKYSYLKHSSFVTLGRGFDCFYFLKVKSRKNTFGILYRYATKRIICHYANFLF